MSLKGHTNFRAVISFGKREAEFKEARSKMSPKGYTVFVANFFSSPVSVKSGARGVGGLQHRALSRPSKVP